MYMYIHTTHMQYVHKLVQYNSDRNYLGRFEQVTFSPRSASIKHDTNSGIMHNVAHYPASVLCDPCNIFTVGRKPLKTSNKFSKKQRP